MDIHRNRVPGFQRDESTSTGEFWLAITVISIAAATLFTALLGLFKWINGAGF